MQTKILGFFLVLAGCILLLAETHAASLTSFLTWSFILFIIGAFLVFLSFLNKQSQLTLAGGLLAVIGISVWGIKYVENWPKDWSVILMMIGVVLLLQYILNQNNMTLVIGIAIFLIGLFAWPGLKEISYLAPIASITNIYWPIIVVGLGILFIFRKGS